MSEERHNTRNGPEWQAFLAQQRERILERLARYNDPTTVREQLDERGDLTPYQRYKIGTVSPYLRRALAKMDEGSYGVCDRCNGEIAHERLLLIPAAVQCAACGKEEDPR
jgi:RNA polymerase-binding transcription factor DksA